MRPRRFVSRNGELKPPEKLVSGSSDEIGTGACKSCLVRSASRKKNNLSFKIGPRRLPPNWLRWKGEGGPGRAAARELSRKSPKASPCTALVPERVVTFTPPEDVSS